MGQEIDKNPQDAASWGPRPPLLLWQCRRSEGIGSRIQRLTTVSLDLDLSGDLQSSGANLQYRMNSNIGGGKVPDVCQWEWDLWLGG
jgi:hypothetical protein